MPLCKFIWYAEVLMPGYSPTFTIFKVKFTLELAIKNVY